MKHQAALSTPHGALGTQEEEEVMIEELAPFNSTRCIRNAKKPKKQSL